MKTKKIKKIKLEFISDFSTQSAGNIICTDIRTAKFLIEKKVAKLKVDDIIENIVSVKNENPREIKPIVNNKPQIQRGRKPKK